jgi:hypothetical protein
MERDVTLSYGAEPGSSGASGGPAAGAEKDNDSSDRINEPEDEDSPEADTLSHSSAYTSSEGDSYSDESAMEEELSDSDSEGATSVPRTSPQESGRRRKHTNRISYSDLSYLNSLSQHEKRRIEGEIIKGRKLGECIKISHMTIVNSGKHLWRNLSTWDAKSIWICVEKSFTGGSLESFPL